MKIIIRESQLRRLFSEDVEDFSDESLDDIKTGAWKNEVQTGAQIHNPDGEPEMSDPTNSDDFADTQAPQSFGWGPYSGYWRRF